MFKLIEKIGGVKDFSFYEGSLLYLSKNGIIPQVPTLDFSELLSDKNYPGDFWVIQYLLFWQDKEGKSIVYDLRNKAILYQHLKDQEVYTFRNVDLVGQDILVASKKVDGKRQLSLFSISNKTFTPLNYRINLKARTFEQGKYIMDVSSDLIEVKRINLSGQIVWENSITGKYFDFRREEHQSVMRNFLGVDKSNIWVSLNSGELMGFDLETGILINRVGQIGTPQSLPYKIEKGDYIPFGDLLQLDERKHEIVGLRDKYFVKVDLNQANPRLEYVSVANSMDAHSISSIYSNQSFPFDEKYIYFCDDQQGKIGVFDREDLKVIWTTDLEMERDGIAQILDMKYANNRWYVQDRNDVLHIFERL